MPLFQLVVLLLTLLRRFVRVPAKAAGGRFVQVQGCTWRDAGAMLAASEMGRGRSSCEGGDGSDAGDADPLWLGCSQGRPLNEDLPLPNEDQELGLSFIATQLLNLARSVKQSDCVVLFGRDLYPVQPFLAAWANSLPGTWIYVEGVSRNVVREEEWAIQKTIHRIVRECAPTTTRILAVDTGFAGSIPLGVFPPEREYDGRKTYPSRLGLEEKFVEVGIRLMSCDSLLPERGATFLSSRRAVRACVLSIEHWPKPFLRSSKLQDIGEYELPEMRLACREDILAACGILKRAEEIAEELEPYVAQILCLPHKEWENLLWWTIPEEKNIEEVAGENNPVYLTPMEDFEF